MARRVTDRGRIRRHWRGGQETPFAPHYDPATMPHSSLSPGHAATLPPVAIAVSRFNSSITDRLLEGAMGVYAARGGELSAVAVLDAPGSFELPAIALAAAKAGRFAGVVALGCLIRGQTRHDRYIAQAVANGLVSVTIATGLPVTFGVLTVETAEQARDRAGGARGNKGADAMAALLDTLAVTDSLAHAVRAGDLTLAGARIAAPDKARHAAVGGR
jgi:6,7-dimethyl-8-ribityllumazine synthase